MEALRRKWNSDRGASILLALLFLLVCMMVGASVLMAAASNAGKIRSNREEQQKYFTLSSALTLLCDELQEAEYVGKYSYGYVEVMKEVEVTGPDGNPKKDWVHDYNEHYYWQEAGELRKKGSTAGEDWSLKEVFPLYNDMDAVFAKAFVSDSSAHINRVPRSDLPAALGSYVMSIRVAGDKDGPYGALTDFVEINARVDDFGSISLTAALTSDREYVMEARLKPTNNDDPGTVLLIGSKPDGGCMGTEYGLPFKGHYTNKSNNVELNETEKTLTWTLEYIGKRGGTS